MDNNEPIFKSVGQALSFSFYMLNTEARTKGSMQQMADLMPRSGEWLDHVPSSINAGGLTPLELRTQCALVTASVQDHLTIPERDSIYARFAYNIPGKTDLRLRGVRGLRDYFSMICVTRSSDALLALVWAIYRPSKRRGDGWALRSIEKEYGISKDTLQRDQTMLRQRCASMENQATAKLDELFVRTMLVVDPAYA